MRHIKDMQRVDNAKAHFFLRLPDLAAVAHNFNVYRLLLSNKLFLMLLAAGEPAIRTTAMGITHILMPRCQTQQLLRNDTAAEGGSGWVGV